ncbi:MAG: uncharacterized protein KVP18_002896 [Porospora cf. gigantea A]|uniref:uncharacterized protein n=1 Tax=Porospora cf. gigantea A TaxID=2853593 RepID=UPI00355AAE6F|nr:MAG: hypothetical protein KVP18_002896 [Porospora cf. gigantea A]
MGRKKRSALELQPFCYYCERHFTDEKVLIEHQKAKHFKCNECNRKLDTATGLVVHKLQVHKSTIRAVPNAIEQRDDATMIIHGMEGVPAHILDGMRQKQQEKKGHAKKLKSEHTIVGSSFLPVELLQPPVQTPQALPHTPVPALPLMPGAPPVHPGGMMPGMYCAPGMPMMMPMPMPRPMGHQPPVGFLPPGSTQPPTVGGHMPLGFVTMPMTSLPAQGTLMYDDDLESPEEKRSRDPKYAFVKVA